MAGGGDLCLAVLRELRLEEVRLIIEDSSLREL